MSTDNVAEQSASEKQVEKTKGQLFKEKHGYSKTMKRLMNNYGCTTVEQYRVIRRANVKKRKARSKQPKL